MGGQSPIEMYEAAIARLESGCDDDWFCDRLAKCHTVDEAAKRDISERHLGAVLKIAQEECHRRHAEEDILDAVQEGNAALIETILSFRGTTAAEFAVAMSAAVTARVTQYLDAT